MTVVRDCGDGSLKWITGSEIKVILTEQSNRYLCLVGRLMGVTEGHCPNCGHDLEPDDWTPRDLSGNWTPDGGLWSTCSGCGDHWRAETDWRVGRIIVWSEFGGYLLPKVDSPHA